MCANRVRWPTTRCYPDDAGWVVVAPVVPGLVTTPARNQGGTSARKTVSTYRGTVQQLSHAQKTSKGAPAYSRFVNRRAGRYLAAAAYRAGRTPNEVTAVSAAFSAVAIVLVALVRPTAVIGVVVAVLLAVGYAFDSADGQLARLRGGGTPAGEWLDHMVDAVKLSSLHLAVLIGLYRSGAVGALVLLIPIAYCVADGALFFAMMLNEALRAQH